MTIKPNKYEHQLSNIDPERFLTQLKQKLPTKKRSGNIKEGTALCYTLIDSSQSHKPSCYYAHNPLDLYISNIANKVPFKSEPCCNKNCEFGRSCRYIHPGDLGIKYLVKDGLPFPVAVYYASQKRLDEIQASSAPAAQPVDRALPSFTPIEEQFFEAIADLNQFVLKVWGRMAALPEERDQSLAELYAMRILPFASDNYKENPCIKENCDSGLDCQDYHPGEIRMKFLGVMPTKAFYVNEKTYEAAKQQRLANLPKKNLLAETD
jgi:hypothetical protein